MNEREYPVPKRDYSRAPLFPLPREGWALLAGDSVRACAAKDVSKVESKVRKGDYTRAVHLISRPEPDQRMISLLQRNFQPVDYERFEGAAVVTYKVGQHFSAGPPQPEPPSALPREQ